MTVTLSAYVFVWPAPSVTVRLTWYVPPLTYVWLRATTVPVVIDPSPKLHARDTMPWSSLGELLLNVQVVRVHVYPNRATGGRSGGGVVVTVAVALELWPAPSYTVSVTTCVP